MVQSTPKSGAGVASLRAAIKRWTGLDRPILFTILARSWSTFAGVVTVVLIARFLKPVQQGYYYTFASLVACQMVFELGFSFVILQTAAHERSRIQVLSNKEQIGDPVALARIASLLKKSIRWYTIAALLMTSTLVILGMRFFSAQHQNALRVDWAAPWILVISASFFTFQMDPVVSLLEGCGQVAGVARLRLNQAVLGSILAWGALLCHRGLFAPAMTILGQGIGTAHFLCITNGRLLRSLLKIDTSLHGISWRKDILPFQWKIAVSWAGVYLIFQLFNPILFAYRGPVAAGQMGMSMSVASAMSAVAISWMSTKAAPMGVLVAQNRISELDNIFRKTLIQSTALLVVGVVSILLALWALVQHAPAICTRILPLPSFVLLLITVILGHIVGCIAYYLRAHKQEPFLWFWIAIAAVAVSGITLAAKFSGVFAVTLVYFLCGGVLRLAAATYILFKKRREWHGEWYKQHSAKFVTATTGGEAYEGPSRS